MNKLKQLIPEVILASASEGRRQVLEECGIKVISKPTQCDETCSLTDPACFVKELALRKMKSYLKKYPDPALTVITADTIVWFNKKIIGKDYSAAKAEKQLREFSGNTHFVYSGCAIFFQGKLTVFSDFAEVQFNKLSEDVISSFIESGNWKGAAGSYRLQKGAEKFVLNIKGDKNTVIGLPLNKISDIILTAGSSGQISVS